MTFETRLVPALRQQIETHLGRFERRPSERRGKRAAVAMTFVADDRGDACFLLTRRARGLRRHSGQWALPGGRIDEGESAPTAARRELAEELGLELPETSLLGLLDDFATRSGYVITPAVLWAGEAVDLEPNPDEVAVVHRVPIASLDREDVPFLEPIPESDRPVLSMPLMGDRVFAPTAAIIYQMLEVCLRGNAVRVAHFEQPLFAWR